MSAESETDGVESFEVGFCSSGHVQVRLTTVRGVLELWLDREAAANLALELVRASDEAMMAMTAVVGHA